MPIRFKEHFFMQVAYFAPHELTVSGEGTYPSIWIDTPRVRNRQFFTYVEKARQNVIQKWIEDMIKKLQHIKAPDQGFSTEPEPEPEETLEEQESSGSSEGPDIDPMLTSKRDSKVMMTRIDLVDIEEEERLAEEARLRAERDLAACGHLLHRKSRSPLTGKGSPLLGEEGKKLPWKRLSFFERRLEAQKEAERVYAQRHRVDHTCGHHYHRKSRSSITGVSLKTLRPIN